MTCCTEWLKSRMKTPYNAYNQMKCLQSQFHSSYSDIVECSAQKNIHLLSVKILLHCVAAKRLSAEAEDW